VKVNGAELTDRDLLREMFALFPYAKLHGGFPKKEEKEIRQGALQMIIFEELVYQEAVRRKMTIAPARITREEHNFKGQFASHAEFNAYLKTELGGSEAKLRQMIKRSLLIEAMLKQEVDAKSVVTLAEARSYYEKNRSRSSTARRLACKRFRLFLRTRRARRWWQTRAKRQKAFWRKRKRPRTTSSLDCWRRKSRKTTFGWIWATGKW